VSTNVSEEHITSIFRFENISSARNQSESRLLLLATCFYAELIFSTLKMEAICSSETSVDAQRPTRHYIPLCSQGPPLFSILSWTDPSLTHTLPRYISKINFNIVMFRNIVLVNIHFTATPWHFKYTESGSVICSPVSC
jgi:hypothetical protein